MGIFSKADKSGQVNEMLMIRQRAMNPYIVDTPASIAEDIVRAVKRVSKSNQERQALCHTTSDTNQEREQHQGHRVLTITVEGR